MGPSEGIIGAEGISGVGAPRCGIIGPQILISGTCWLSGTLLTGFGGFACMFIGANGAWLGCSHGVSVSTTPIPQSALPRR